MDREPGAGMWVVTTGLAMLVLVGVSIWMIQLKTQSETPAPRPVVTTNPTPRIETPIPPPTEALAEQVYRDLVQTRRMTAGELALQLARSPQPGFTLPAGVSADDELVVRVHPGPDGVYGTADDRIIDARPEL